MANPAVVAAAGQVVPPDPSFWSSGEPRSRQAAVVCARGHVITSGLNQVPGPAGQTYGFCEEDGTPLLARCSGCGMRIKGGVPMGPFAGYIAYKLPTFCDLCGAAHPWATREDRLNQLQYLAEAEVDPDRRKAANAALEQLKHDGLRKRREAKLWKQVQTNAPTLLNKGWTAAQPLLTAYLKHKLHLDATAGTGGTTSTK